MQRPRWLEIVLVVAIVTLVAISVRASFIPSFHDRHVQVSEEKYDFDVGDPGPWFSAWSLGDGQAFVLIGLDPTGNKLDEEIDETWYRYGRAGFGWLTFIVSLGIDGLIPFAMAAVGALSLIGLSWLAIRLRPELGPRAYLLLANPAIYIAFGGDTSESLAVFLLAAGMATNSVLLAVALAVTRPSYLVALVGRWRQLKYGILAAALLALYVLIVFGGGAMIPSGGRLSLPMAGFVTEPSLGGGALALAALTTFIVGWRERNIAWIASASLVLCFGAAVVVDPANAWRAAGFIPVLWAFGPNWTRESEPIGLPTVKWAALGRPKPVPKPSDVP